MKTIVLALLAALTPADPCVCGGCDAYIHREALGPCATCTGRSQSIDDKICAMCARKGTLCAHCGKPHRDPRVLVGEASVVDKQPRPDLTYFVFKGEDGKPQGLYADVKRYVLKGRMLLFAVRDAKGDLVVRQACALAAKEKDLEVKGESEGPVFWYAGSVKGPAIPAKDGKFALVLPAVPGMTFEVMSGEKLLSVHRFEDGAWKQVK